MTIPETQLDTWAKQGAGIGSRDTYAQIKAVLESTGSPYFTRDFDVFLQGSYGNDTNIYSESDVDIVIQLTSSFQYGLEDLSVEQKSAFQAAYTGGVSYSLTTFKQEVLAHLQARYGTDVVSGKRAINILANGNRRSADVIVCMDYRRYRQFSTTANQSYYEGIFFKASDGTSVKNYPKFHSANCTAKHQATSSYYKPTVRIFKNLRSKLIATGALQPGDAPSYFIEGMLWNVPNENFGRSYQETVLNCLVWLNGCDRSKLVCANDQYMLLHPTSPVTWTVEKFEKFLAAACTLWSDW